MASNIVTYCGPSHTECEIALFARPFTYADAKAVQFAIMNRRLPC